MKAGSQRHALMATALAVSLQGCATKPQATLEVRPAPMASARMSAADGLYYDAVAAIDRRDYARALDLLQASRDRGGDNARVLNGFGVVYDKLGRFDLSQRYYLQAQALDPASTIVAQNLAYSRVLQGEAPTAGTALAEAPVVPQATPQTPAQSPTPASDRTALAQAGDDRATTASAAPLAGPAPPLALSSRGPSAVAAAPLPAKAVRFTSAPQWQPEEPAPQALAATPRAAPQQVAALHNAPAAQPAPVAPVVRASTVPAPRALAAAETTRPPAMRVAPQQVVALRAAPAAQPAATPAIVRVSTTPTPRAVAPAEPTHQPAARTLPPQPLTLRANAVAAQKQAAAPPTRAAADRTQVAMAKPIVRKAQQPPASMRAPNIRLVSASTTISLRPRAQANAHSALMGRPILVVYTGGGKRGADQLRSDLARRGWTLSVATARFPAPAKTTIRYAPVNERIALALGRSLRVPVKLERCRTRCTGVTILMGAKGTLRVAGAGRDGAPRLG